MKCLIVLVAVVAYASAGCSQIPNSSPEPLMHTETAFDLVVYASYTETAPLFGPEGERAWAGKHWDPQFIYPLPARDVGGAVFTIKHGPFNATWVTTIFDMEARHFQYVYFLPDLMVTTIDVYFKPADAASTQVKVVYTRTALTLAGNEHVTAMSEGDKSSGKGWQQAIDAYLAGRKR
jgi:hypothetical protein